MDVAANEGLAEQQIMRNGQNNNKRMRGRNRKGSGGGHHQNPLSRMYESNGPDVKIRGTASHVAEKYLQLARDAQSSGDFIAAENFYQHAEHYFRLIAAAHEQLRQTQPFYQPQSGDMRGNYSDDSYDDGDNEQPVIGGEPFAPREPQPYYPQHQQQHQQQAQPQHFQPRPQQMPQRNDEDVERLPSFITGGQQSSGQQGQGPGGQGASGQSPNGETTNSQGANGQNSNGQNSNGYEGQPDRFPLHRRRRRHRGPRDHAMPGDNDGQAPAGSRPIED
jgi:hypothetical protein